MAASKNDFEELWLELQIDQGYRVTHILVGINESGEFIISITIPRICELINTKATWQLAEIGP